LGDVWSGGKKKAGVEEAAVMTGMVVMTGIKDMVNGIRRANT
jgi:hypothetical protein